MGELAPMTDPTVEAPMSQDERDVKPSEQRGGSTPGDDEARAEGAPGATPVG